MQFGPPAPYVALTQLRGSGGNGKSQVQDHVQLQANTSLLCFGEDVMNMNKERMQQD